VFWKDSLDFTRIIKKGQDHVETKTAMSPERTRAKQAAEKAISSIMGSERDQRR
jgi:hypothetical protein